MPRSPAYSRTQAGEIAAATHSNNMSFETCYDVGFEFEHVLRADPTLGVQDQDRKGQDQGKGQAFSPALLTAASRWPVREEDLVWPAFLRGQFHTANSAAEVRGRSAADPRSR